MRKFYFIVLAFITIQSCTKDENCAGIIIHQVKITDSLGKAVVFDKFFTICLNTKPDTLVIDRYLSDSLQYYPLIDDTYSDVFTKKEVNTNFKFVGIKGTDTLTSPYVFKYDGCHIQLISGVSKIIHQK